MTHYMYHGGFLFGKNIIIAKMMVLLDFIKSITLEVPTIGSPTTYNASHDPTRPEFHSKDKLCHKCKKV